ncbi:hypothetical protein [Shimia sp.]|uniref:hypothetical protein n=1 Tax=Shimia sp. TaxID=1954381 RepID=UPI003BAD9871
MDDNAAIDVIDEIFREFDAQYATLDQKTREAVLLRCALRDLFNPSFSPSLDISARYLLPQCRVLIQSLCLRQAAPRGFKQLLKLTCENILLSDDMMPFEHATPIKVARLVLFPNLTEELEAIHDVGVGFASFAREQELQRALTLADRANDEYDMAAQHIAKVALRDCNQSNTNALEARLWHDLGRPFESSENLRAYGAYNKSAAFSFWRRWYQGFLDGKPLNWELQRRVALIADDIWEAGPEAVADEIERIQVRYLADQLPLAETIDLNPDTGKFRAIPTPVENAPLMSALLTQISDDLEDAMAGHNGVTEKSSEARKIRRVVTRYGNDPQQAELTLTSVAKGLRRQLYETGELPDSEDNLALLNSVEEGVRGIRANHPEVAANREQLAQLAIQELSAEDRETLETAAPVLSAISEGAMAEDFAEDIPELINDAVLPLPSGAPRLPGADASTRIFSRVSKMALLSEKTKAGLKKGAEAFDSDLVKTIQLAGVTIGLGAGAVGFLYKLVEIGLRVFGVL